LTNVTAYFDLEVSWNPKGCPEGQIGLGTGCVVTNSTVLSTIKQSMIQAQTSQYFSVDLSIDDNSFLQTTVTPVDNSMFYRSNAAATNTTPSMDVEIRRQAVPQDGLSDATGTLENGAYVATIDSPVPNTTYYIQVTNNEQNPIVYNLVSVSQTCGAGLFGPNCTSTAHDLTNTWNATLYTGTGDYQYFYVNRRALLVGVGTEKLEETAPALLASIWNYPSNESTLVSSVGQTVNYITAHNPPENPDNTWYITVWANDGQDYYIWANVPCPNNCTGVSAGNTTRGTCNEGAGVCECDKGYGDLFCDKSGLKLVWIIIIVIVCAIILAIAIGVPVACFLRNRRRARYERV